MPLSLVGTFGVMYLVGYSIDNLSLMALTIATGFVVDDAIVVTENITRHIERGVAPITAALDGAREIGFTIVSITTSLLAVFIPMLFMGGLVGEYFREFAVTLAVAVVMSAIISLTLTPMMCSRLLRPSRPHEVSSIGRLLDRGLSRLIDGYGRALKAVLRHKNLVFVLTLGTCGGTAYTFYDIFANNQPVARTLFPQQDTGMLGGQSFGPQDISYAAMKERQQEINAIVKADRDVDHVISSIGGFGSSTINTGSLFISLKPQARSQVDRRPGHRSPASRSSRRSRASA